MRRVRVEEPAAVGAELLDRPPATRPGPAGSSARRPRRSGPPRRAGSSGRRRARRRRARRGTRSAAGSRGSPRVQSNQKFPMPAAFSPRDAADDRDRHRDPGRGRQEVVQREPGHLREVGHRALARVALPVRVRREGDRRVPGGVGRDRSEAVRVQRQPALEALKPVEQDERRAVDDEHRDRPLHPGLVLPRVDAAEAIDPALERAEHAVEKRPLRREHPFHVRAEDRRERDHDPEVEEDPDGLDLRQGVRPSRPAASRRAGTRAVPTLTARPTTSSQPIALPQIRSQRRV